MLTEQEIQLYRQKYGLEENTSNVQPIQDANTRIQALRQAYQQSQGVQPEQPEQKQSQPLTGGVSGTEQVKSEKEMTGWSKVGKAIAENPVETGINIGQAIANITTHKAIDKANQDLLDSGDTLMNLAKKTADINKKKQLINLANESYHQVAENYPEILPAIQKTNEQIAGEAGGTLVDILAAGNFPGVAKTATQATGVLKGVLQGAKTGAMAGGAFGVGQGITQGMKENKDIKNVAIEGVESGLGGAVGGAVLGGITGGIAGGIKATKQAKENMALNAIIPTPKELTPTEYEELLSQGKVTPKTAFGSAKIVPTKKQIELANKYSDILKTKDPVKNLSNVSTSISSHDKEVGNYLTEHNGIFSDGELKNAIKIKLDPITDPYLPDPTRFEKMKDSLIDSFIDGLKKNDLETLWKSRKEYDSMIDTQLNAFKNNPTLMGQVSKGVRNGIQEFINTTLNKQKTAGIDIYAGHMKEMTDLFDLKEMILNKAVSEKGISAIQKWIKLNPAKAKAIGFGTAALGLGALEGSKISHFLNIGE